MEQKALADPMTELSDLVLEKALGKNYAKFQEFSAKANELGLVLEWRYYNDGKSWLCKVLHKKKNLCWLSVWNTGFKLTFYFSESALEGIFSLAIADEIKKSAKEAVPVGKLRPVILLVSSKKLIADGLKIIEYKKGLK